MKKLMICFLALLMLVGCAAAPSPASDAYTFTDALGRQVSVSAPQRVAILIGSFADLWSLAGGENTIVAAAHDSWTEFELPLSQDVIDIGSSKEPNLELILQAEPDFIIASANTSANLELEDTLTQLGIPVAYFSVSTYEEYLSMLKICTDITGQTDRYARYGTAISEEIAAAKERIDGSKPSALYLRVSSTGIKVKNSEDSVLGEMLRDLGAVNIADSDATLLDQLSMEAILLQEPAHIFIILQGSDKAGLEALLDETLRNDPAWQSLKAVKNGNVHILENRLFNLKPNARWGEAYETLAELLYP